MVAKQHVGGKKWEKHVNVLSLPIVQSKDQTIREAFIRGANAILKDLDNGRICVQKGKDLRLSLEYVEEMD